MILEAHHLDLLIGRSTKSYTKQVLHEIDCIEGLELNVDSFYCENPGTLPFSLLYHAVPSGIWNRKWKCTIVVYTTELEYRCYTSSILTRGRSAELITGRAKSGRRDQTKREKGKTRCRKLYNNKGAERGGRSVDVDTSMRTFLIIRVFGTVVSLLN